MKYLDSGSREPDQAIGTWLSEELVDPSGIASLRWQSGFFGAGVLGYFASTFDSLRQTNGPVSVLVGSNDGTTRRADVASLLRLAGSDRPEQQIAVVSFDRGFFHPKTVHLGRADGSSAAYIGSANLTESGVSGLHVEAGLILDTRDGDDPSVLADVADAVDRWFGFHPPGMYPVASEQDLDALVSNQILDVPRPPSARGSGGTAAAAGATGARLSALVVVPPVPGTSQAPATQMAPNPSAGAVAPASTSSPAASAAAPSTPASSAVAERWEKTLTQSDAQRKLSGNQRGSITLVGGRPAVDSQRYFRFDFFQGAAWGAESTRTGRVRESAVIPFRVRVDAVDRGIQSLLVSYAPNREAGQNNYTSLLHLGLLAADFASTEMQGRTLTLTRTAGGDYGLSIS